MILCDLLAFLLEIDMAVMTTIALVTAALKAIDVAIDLYKDQTPSWEQKEAKKIFNKYQYLKGLYEVETKKPRYVEGQDNTNARSESRMLNLRDLCISNGSAIVEQIRQSKG